MIMVDRIYTEHFSNDVNWTKYYASMTSYWKESGFIFLSQIISNSRAIFLSMFSDCQGILFMID